MRAILSRVTSESSEFEIRDLQLFIMDNSEDKELISERNLNVLLLFGATCIVEKEDETILSCSIELIFKGRKQIVLDLNKKNVENQPKFLIEDDYIIYTYYDKLNNFSFKLCTKDVIQPKGMSRVISYIDELDFYEDQWKDIFKSGAIISWKLYLLGDHICNVILMSTSYDGRLCHKIVYLNCLREGVGSMVIDYIISIVRELGSHMIYSYTNDTSLLIF